MLRKDDLSVDAENVDIPPSSFRKVYADAAVKPPDEFCAVDS